MPDTLVLKVPQNLGNIGYDQGYVSEEDNKLYIIEGDGVTTQIVGGVVSVIDNTTNAGNLLQPYATNDSYGLIKPDGVTCAINEDGNLYVITTIE